MRGYPLCLLLPLLPLLLRALVRAEWVEIPQFSDHRKIYRQPVSLEANRRLYLLAATATPQPDYQSLGFRKITQGSSLRNVSEISGNRHPSFLKSEPEFVGTISTLTTDSVISGISEENVEDEESEVDESVEIESSENEENLPEFVEMPLTEDAKESTTLEPTEATTLPLSNPFDDSSEETQYKNETEGEKGFFDYLPVDLLKRVHKTLKSQPATLKGKIRFLKAFERTLLSEIESRLSLAIAPARKPRGAWEHDDHEDGIGFPSLEGTLMAISFLTFAVYLVRLVMMLFRNSGNGAGPIFIGRKKRSIDDFTEETARILSYLDSALPRQY